MPNVTMADVIDPTYLLSEVTVGGNATVLEVYAGFVILQAYADDPVVSGTYKSFLPISALTVRGYGSASSQDVVPITAAVCVSPGGFSAHDANSSVSVEASSAKLEAQSFPSQLGNPHCLILTVKTKVQNSQLHRVAYNVSVLSRIEVDTIKTFALQSGDRPA